MFSIIKHYSVNTIILCKKIKLQIRCCENQYSLKYTIFYKNNCIRKTTLDFGLKIRT